MVDVFSSEKRSQIMARVKGSGNLATEERLVQTFRAYKISGWRRKSRIFGKPDFVFRKSKLTVFVDGCFWHGCPIHGELPTTNRAFWKSKLERNRKRDVVVNRTLRRNGWKVIRLWQHDLRNSKKIAQRVAVLLHN